MRLWPLMICCMSSAVPVVARDLSLSANWDIATPAELVTILRRADGGVLTITRMPVGLTDQSLTWTMLDLPRQTANVQAALVGQNAIRAQSAVIPLDPRAESVNIELTRHLATSVALEFDCGERLGIAKLRPWASNRTLTLSNAFALADLQQADDAELEWSASDGTKVSLVGSSMQLTGADGVIIECAALPSRPIIPLDAWGSDPDWHLQIRADGADVSLPLTSDVAVVFTNPIPARQTPDGAISFATDIFKVQITDDICRNGAKLVPYPLTATLETGPDDSFAGCAGHPMELVKGPEWRVTSLLGRPIDAALTLTFVENEVSGRGTCNRYLAALDFADGWMQVSDLGTTRLACGMAASNLEQRFLNALESSNSFDIGNDGTLILHAGVMPVLTAQRR